MQKAAVVILNWNTEGFLRRFLPGLVASMPEGCEVIVADNASTDDSLRLMASQFPQVRVIALDRNYGFTGGYNRAFLALEDLYEYFLLINSDIEVPPSGWLEPLLAYMDAHPDCGACAPKLHAWQERDSFEYAGAAGGFIDRYGYPFCRGRVLKKLERDYGQYDSPRAVFWASGACLLVRSALYRELGGLDERFFAHMEEIDLCWRMQRAGYHVAVVPASTVWHIGGGTLPPTSPRKLYLNYRNNLLMLHNNLPKRGRLLTRMVLDGLSAAVYLFTGQWRNLAAVWRAHRDFRRLKGQNGHTLIPCTARYTKPVWPTTDRWIIPMAVVNTKKTFNFVHSL